MSSPAHRRSRRGLRLGGADCGRDAFAVLCGNAHHQLPEAPPPPDEPPPPEKPPDEPEPLELPDLRRMSTTTFKQNPRKNQRNPGETMSSVTKAMAPAMRSQ